MISYREIQELKNIIIEQYNPSKIILFGSYANETASETSDLDLLIISDKEKNLPRWKRGLTLRLELSRYKFPKDLLFYTNEEVTRWVDTPRSFIHSIFKTGRVLYEQK